MEKERVYISDENLEEAIESLITTDILKRQRCVKIIRMTGERGFWALLHLAETGNAQQQFTALRLLPQFCWRNRPLQSTAIECLIRAYDSEPSSRRLQQIIYIIRKLHHDRFNEPILEQLLSGLFDDDAGVRLYLADVMGRNAYEKAVPYLVLLLEDEDSAVAEAAYFSLRRMSHNSFGRYAAQRWSMKRR